MTCWTLIEAAAAGRSPEREEFARRYGPVVEEYLGSRWRTSPLRQEVADATQELFVECFRQGGLLEKLDSRRPGGFRAFLYGATRNIARRYETRRARQRDRQAASQFDFGNVEGDESTLSQVFDRAWAQSLLREALSLLVRRAREQDARALRRVELLRLRSYEGLPIREIATRWQMDADRLHDAYARARREFKRALQDVVAFHHPGSAGEIERECAELLDLLQ